MDATSYLMVAIFGPVVCGLATLLLPRRSIGARVALALAGPVLAMTFLGLYVRDFGVGTVAATAWMPALQLNLAFNPDQLGLFFALLVSGIGFFITLYARAYFGRDEDSLYRFYPSLHLFMTAMIGVALADNFMLLLLFWEMTSISSFLLIGWERDQPIAVRNAMQAFIVTALGGLTMMGGLILLGVNAGQWTFTGLLAQGVEANAWTTVGFVLIFIGAAAKSAHSPFHFWLPGAMAAPTPVSAYLHSATMVKAGVYLTGRMWPILAAAVPLWPKLIIPLGAATMVYGAFIALQKTDLKQIFAYTTVSQLGLLMTMYGLSHFVYHEHPNLIWDVTQILNHAFYKAPLFILAGAIGHVASRELPELRGFFHRDKTARIMTIILLLAGYGMAAGPLTLSFTAKEFFFYQIAHAYKVSGHPTFYLLIAAGVATGMFNVAIFVRLATTLCARPHAAEHGHDEHHDHSHGHGHGHGDDHHETGIWPAFLWIPGLCIVAFQYIGGMIPGAYEAVFGWLDPSRGNYDFHAHHGAFPMTWDAHLGLPLYMSLAAMALGVALGLAPLLRGTYKDPFDHGYTGFFNGVTKQLGPWAFGLMQRGHIGFYVGAYFLAAVLLFGWAHNFDPAMLIWPEDATIEPFGELLPGYLLAGMVCLTAVLLPLARDPRVRVLVLGTCGFSVTGVYYLYKAPDLALTQISIEIVSLILFLLVLSMLPDAQSQAKRHAVRRLVIAGMVGMVFFWLTLTSAVGPQKPMPYVSAEGNRFAHLGEYFLRNSHHGVDTEQIASDDVYGAVVKRPTHAAPGGDHDHANEASGHEGHAAGDAVSLHHGGGGNNVVNVILVDFRGFDTMGEITVLGLAAMGVWTLLRRQGRKPEGSTDV